MHATSSQIRKKKKKKQLDSNIHLVPVLEFEEQPPLIPIL